MTNNEFIALIRKLSECVGVISTLHFLAEGNSPNEDILEILNDDLNEAIDTLIEDKFKELDTK
jgi:DNA-binding ferritin-like protein (Dps family)